MADIPNFQFGQVIDKESGYFTPNWQIALDQLLSALQDNIGPEGVVSPSLDSTSINLLASKPNGTIVYDSTDDLLKVKVAGVFQTIPTMAMIEEYINNILNNR